MRRLWPLLLLSAASCSADTASDRPADAGPDPIDDGAVDAPFSGDEGCHDRGMPAATARCLEPTMTPEYYVDQANKYFDTLDTTAPEDSIPAYSDLSARWEWPPWLLLTGYERDQMIETAAVLRAFDPSTVPERDCRFFERQPFARCYVVFEYEGGRCPIYEEFVFNDAGEMTFIEAWSDLPGYLPTDDPEDRWAEGPDVDRLSTRVPGLGNAEGRIDLDAEWMTAAAAEDEMIADFVRRARDFWPTWFDELTNAPEDFFATGCGWESAE